MKLYLLIPLLPLFLPSLSLSQSTVQIDVTWTAVPFATSYDLERSVDGGPFISLGNVTENKHTSVVPVGHEYRTQVKAKNAVSTSPDWSVPCTSDAREVGNVGSMQCTVTPLP